MGEKEMTKEDVLFYLDMIDSSHGPSFKPKIGKLKPYYPLLKEGIQKSTKGLFVSIILSGIA